MTAMAQFLESMIIRRAKHLPVFVHIRDAVLTILIWAGYMYLMEDFVAFAHDAALWIYHGFDDATQYPGLKTLRDVTPLIEIAFCMAGSLVGWSYYNILRYGRKTRRGRIPPLDMEQLAKIHEVDVKDLRAWQNARVLMMHHDEAGRLDGVVMHEVSES